MRKATSGAAGHETPGWELRVQVHRGLVLLYPELQDPSGRVLVWADVPAVDPHEPREAALAARIISTQTHGGISFGHVIRRVRGVAERT